MNTIRLRLRNEEKWEQGRQIMNTSIIQAHGMHRMFDEAGGRLRKKVRQAQATQSHTRKLTHQRGWPRTR